MEELVQEKQKMDDLLFLTLPYPVARFSIRALSNCSNHSIEITLIHVKGYSTEEEGHC